MSWEVRSGPGSRSGINPFESTTYTLSLIFSSTTLLMKDTEMFNDKKVKTPSVFGSADRKWMDFENKMAAQYRDKRRPSAAALEHYHDGELL